jgi:hypothetical protein
MLQWLKLSLIFELPAMLDDHSKFNNLGQMKNKFSNLTSYIHLIIFFFTVTILLSSCSEGVIDLDDKQKQSLKFDQLPPTVQLLIETNLDNIKKSKGDFFTCSDSTIVFQYGSGGAGKGWLQQINSNQHHFFIDGWHFVMRGNQGAPFILDNSQLYYNDELNLFVEKYKECNYFKIDLSNDIQ